MHVVVPTPEQRLLGMSFDERLAWRLKRDAPSQGPSEATSRTAGFQEEPAGRFRDNPVDAGAGVSTPMAAAATASLTLPHAPNISFLGVDRIHLCLSSTVARPS